jgi:hypothetical protein
MLVGLRESYPSSMRSQLRMKLREISLRTTRSSFTDKDLSPKSSRTFMTKSDIRTM